MYEIFDLAASNIFLYYTSYIFYKGDNLQLQHQGGEIEIREKMRSRNRELSQALDENNVMRCTFSPLN